MYRYVLYFFWYVEPRFDFCHLKNNNDNYNIVLKYEFQDGNAVGQMS